MISDDVTNILQTNTKDETTIGRITNLRPEDAAEQTRAAITEAKFAELDQEGNFSYDG